MIVAGLKKLKQKKSTGASNGGSAGTTSESIISATIIVDMKCPQIRNSMWIFLTIVIAWLASRY